MIIILGLIVGIILGLTLNIQIPDIYSTYLTVAILTCLDSVLGAYKSHLNKRFEPLIFISGFFGNAFIAVMLTYMGDLLGLPMYLAAVLVFGGRIFTNFAIIRRLLLKRFLRGYKLDEKIT